MKRSWSIGKLLGIPLDVDISWLAIFLLLTVELAVGLMDRYFPSADAGAKWGMAAALASLLFLCVLLHELAHCWVATRRNIPVEGITLFIFGGVARLSSEPNSPTTELLMAAAGPAMSLLLAGVAAALAWSVSMFSFFGAGARLFTFLATMNISLALFNLIPGFPLDGGRIFRACLWGVLKDFLRATRIATLVGQGFGMALAALGVWMVFRGNLGQGIWFGMIGWFLAGAARVSYEQMMLGKLFSGLRVENVMNPHVETVPPDLTLGELIDRYFLTRPTTTFPVVENGEFKGMVTLQSVRRVSRERWTTTPVIEAMQPLDNDEWVSPGDDLREKLLRILQGGDHRFLVIDRGQIVGSVGRSELRNYMRVRTELGV